MSLFVFAAAVARRPATLSRLVPTVSPSTLDVETAGTNRRVSPRTLNPNPAPSHPRAGLRKIARWHQMLRTQFKDFPDTKEIKHVYRNYVQIYVTVKKTHYGG